ncbi:ROK family transcriptional regulator [Nakamurella deserti]|uniref:ROK family transcriptional regulator n=1 Tax=Nakamurella deserti TaxID=2164074 RepID=UPI0014797888|nr:ROK family transcriptional regulator [Nakamurella deserti]
MTESARSLSPGSPARQASLRAHNLGVLLAAVVDSTTPPSRADLAQLTGLTRATVSALTDRLLAAGLVTVLPTVRAVSAGRPAAPLVPAAGTLAAVGAEIDVDHLAVRVVDLTGATLGERIVPGDHRSSDPAPVLAALAALCRDVVAAAAADLPVAGLCVALPGLVDSGAGRLRIAPNLGWRDVDVVGALSGLLDRPGLRVVQANEATLAAQAEARALRESGVTSFFYVSGEIGIGGALVRDGRIVAGSHGWSGEIGHTLVDPAGPRCGCGASGCLEQYAGTDALRRRAGLPIDRGVGELSALAGRGAPGAVAALQAAGHALGLALSTAVNLLDVDTVVLGGTFAALVDHLREPLQQQLRSRVLWDAWAPVAVRPALVTSGAALAGAALSIRSEIVRDPLAWIER